MKWLLTITMALFLIVCSASSVEASQLAKDGVTKGVKHYTPLIRIAKKTKKEPLRLICPVGIREVVATYNGVTPNHPEGGHKGYDFEAPIGTEVKSSARGIVTDVSGTKENTFGDDDSLGLRVKIRHADGKSTVYGHLSKSLVRNGQQVERGQPIAETGNSGYSKAPHIHFELWSADNKKRINPVPYLHKKVELGGPVISYYWKHTTCTY